MSQKPTSWLEVSSSKLTHNYKELTKSFSKATKVLAVVKGNAYGHDTKVAVSILKKCKPDFYGVFDPKDVLQVRKIEKEKPILLMVPCTSELVPFALKHNVSLSVDSLDTLQNISKLKAHKPIKIHLCVDTGLGRDGIPHQQLSSVLKAFRSMKDIFLEGLYTHFSGAESKKFDTLTRKQISRLQEWQKSFQAFGLTPIVHASGTAATMLGKNFQLDMCRLGIGLYGLWPSEERRLENKTLTLQPVLSWKTKLVSIKNLPPNHGIGYDQSFITKKATKIGVIPVGYYDGIPRILSNKLWFLINGKKVLLRGKVMMNMCVLDLTGERVGLGDEVTLLGSSKKSQVSIEDWAKLSGQINYELVTRINPYLKRKLLR